MIFSAYHEIVTYLEIYDVDNCRSSMKEFWKLNNFEQGFYNFYLKKFDKFINLREENKDETYKNLFVDIYSLETKNASSLSTYKIDLSEPFGRPLKILQFLGLSKTQTSMFLLAQLSPESFHWIKILKVNLQELSNLINN